MRLSDESLGVASQQACWQGRRGSTRANERRRGLGRTAAEKKGRGGSRDMWEVEVNRKEAEEGGGIGEGI